MRSVPVELAMALRAEGMAWRDVVQEITWATGRRFSHDGIAAEFNPRPVIAPCAEEKGLGT